MHKNRLLFPAACMGMLLFGISLITLGSVAPGINAKYQLDEQSAAILFSILPIGILAGSLIFGPICDRYGYKSLLVFSCILLFCGFQAIAHAASYGLLKILIFLFGLAGGAINGITNAVVSDISSENKKAKLSLLGVFFAIGALGMPFVLGFLENRFRFESIVSAVSFLPLLVALFYLSIRFPPAKQAKGIPLKQSLKLLKDEVLILIAFFLFCQSSFEGIINNWTTTYLLRQFSVSQANALYALSLYVVGMATMRLLIGSVLKDLSSKNILYLSFLLLIIGSTLLKTNLSFLTAVIGLILTGAGLAAGFPVMLGFVGLRYAELSGTAFSFVLAVALIGNMLVNYLMGIIVSAYGITHFTTVVFAEIIIMVLLTVLILRKLLPTNKKYQTNDVVETMA